MIADLHLFGCRVLWLDPSEQKLEAKASEAVYVGYANGGHQLFNPASKRVITRRDVKFLEEEFPLIHLAPSVMSATLVSPRRAAREALSGLRADEWQLAFKKEIANMRRQDV